MKVGHILYRVKNLESAVERFQKKGFTVEYGTKRKPYNALIYFSEGPYLELIGDMKLPNILSFILKIFGKKRVVERINSWHNSKEGLMAICFENSKVDFEEEKKVFDKYGQFFFEKNNKRVDTKNRVLKFKLLFPDNIKIPFLMTAFNVDPKPENYIHPNKIVSVKSVSFGTTEDNISFIKELCDDKRLKLFIGDGVKDLGFEKNNGDVIRYFVKE